MIVVDEGDSLLLITQPDHAHLAAEVLSLCRFPELLENPRREAILRATREHDNGWQELDAAPPVADSGLPHTFSTLPDVMRRELWLRAGRRFREDDPYVALLIVQHALAIHSDRRGDDAWTEWFERTNDLGAELQDKEAIEAAVLETDYTFLHFADLCSLALCAATRAPFEYLGTTGQLEDSELRLGPFPLAGATSFKLTCRRIPHRSYASTMELGLELATARWETRTVRVAPR